MLLKGILILIFGSYAACKNGYHLKHSSCNPDYAIPAAPTCEGLGSYTAVDLKDLYKNYGLFYNVLGSKYYFARMVKALYPEADCPTSNATLYRLNIVTPWSGLNGGTVGIAIDGTKAFRRNILRSCTFPTATYPFLCTGKPGTPRTHGSSLGTLSNIPLLQDKNNRWTLFGQCWNAKRPSAPNAVTKAVSFIVWSLDSSLTDAHYDALVTRLKELGFSTSAENLIRPVYQKF